MMQKTGFLQLNMPIVIQLFINGFILTVGIIFSDVFSNMKILFLPATFILSEANPLPCRIVTRATTSFVGMSGVKI